MKQELRIGCAVPAVAVADPGENVRQICKYMTQAADAGCDILVFPELTLTGCSCGDLLRQQLLLKKAREGLTEVVERSEGCPAMTLVVGFPVMKDGKVQSCAGVIRGGNMLGLAYKDRDAGVFSLENGITLAVAVGAEITDALADITVCTAGDPAIAGSRDKRRQRAMEASKRGLYVYCGAGLGESVTDAVFAGHSLIARHGKLLAENEKTVDGDYLLVADSHAKPLPTVYRTPRMNPQMPFCTGYEDEIFHIQAAALGRRLQLLNAKAVVGVSGGLDSTLALLVAVEAVTRIGRPATDVVAITMPGFGTTGRTYENARTLMDLLGVTAVEIPIVPAVRQHFADIGHDESIHDLTYENAQARERTQILMDYAGKVGGIVVGTGDLSELALGWCTYNGDHMSMYAVNASIPKTLLPEVILQASKLPRYEDARAVLQDIIATPISPELLPPDEKGDIAQQTEDLVGPYLLHDFYLYHTLKDGTEPKMLYDRACEVFDGVFSPKTVKKWLGVFYRRFFTQQFKRNCMSEGVNVTGFSLNPRGDWSMPGDAVSALWQKETEGL